MKHRKTGRQFGRVRAQRKALMRTMLGSLIMYEQIETTQAKAKELKGMIDRMITRILRTQGSANAKMEALRKLEGDVPKEAIIKLRDEIVPRVGERRSGFTRVVKLSPRKSDGAQRAIIAFVDGKKTPVAQKTSTKKTTKATQKDAHEEKND